MALLTLKDIHVTVGDRHLLQGVSLVVGEGERIGLLGPNGCGKSTLLRILAGELVPDSGERTVRRDLRLGYLAQEPILPADATAFDVVVRGIAGRDEVLRALERVHQDLANDQPPERLERLLKEQQRLDEQLEHLGGHDVEHRAEAVLHALGVERVDAKCGAMSGGERRRTALARLLVAQPDLLLLDEPTNHLDAYVTDWLETFLLDAGMPIVMVTHDRYFLDRLCSRIVEFDRGELLHDYDGGYTQLPGAARPTASSARRRHESCTAEHAAPRDRVGEARAAGAHHQGEGAHRSPLRPIWLPTRRRRPRAELEFMIPEGPRLGDFVLRLKRRRQALRRPHDPALRSTSISARGSAWASSAAMVSARRRC